VDEGSYFRQGALYELGSAMSLFQVKNYAEEYGAVLAGGPAAEPVVHDETVAAVAEDIEENTEDFILKTLAQELKGHPFSVHRELIGNHGLSYPRSARGPG
jgi:restriction system protein